MANNIPAAIQAAIAKHQAGDLGAAEQMYRKILSKTPADAGIANLLGVVLFQQNKFAAAEEKVGLAIKLNPVEASFHFNMGNIAKAMGKHEQAESCYRSALRIKPYYPEATKNLANMLEDQGRAAAAALLCQDAIRLNPNDLNAYIKLVSLYEKLEDWANAVAVYQQILVFQPNNLDARYLYALALQKIEQADLAIAQYRLILQNNPQHASAHLNLSRLLVVRGDRGGALQHARLASELAPQNGNAWLNYGGLLLVDEQFEASAAAYRRVLELNPADLSAMHMLTAIENRSSQRAEPEYVRGLFDSYADKFEKHLQHEMGYDIPKKMCGLLTGLDPQKRYQVLDLGCGTGLSGLAVRDFAARMVGVDLSPKMLAQAESKGIYAELHTEDVLSYLQRTPDGEFDLVLSADLFVYLGDLSEVFAEVARVMSAGGVFVFSTEATTANSEQGYKLETTGRYTHRDDYLEALAAQHGYQTLHFAQETIRMNLGKPALGHLVMLRKGEGSAVVRMDRQDARIEEVVRGILSDQYGNSVSVLGWLFAALIDHRFIDGSLVRHAVRRHAPAWRSVPEPADVEQAATGHLERIAGIADPVAQYAALEELTMLNTPSLTRDSFPGVEGNQLAHDIRQLFSAGRLNLVIVGAGPVGLLLASALKCALHQEVNVLLVESRISSPHHKLSYERRWITNVKLSLLQGLVEPSLAGILANVGDSTYMGCTVNVLESLLLLSCRRMGVKFLFADRGDLSFIEDSRVQLVFDASGNRFQPAAWPGSPEQIAVHHDIETSLLGSKNANIAKYGIQAHASEDSRSITLGSHGNLSFPLYKGSPVRLAMMKLIHIPAHFYGALVNYVSRHNEDNKYYVWPGTLQEAINQVIVIINLSKAEYDYLCGAHEFPLSLAEAIKIEAFRAALDARTAAILELLAAHASEDEQIAIDAPFLFEPYLVNCATPDRLYGRPLIRVGDSIYNGNVKCGNGMGSHFQHVRHIQTVLRKHVG
ncbi:MAG: tetratricopeptide repeat protein [Nitrosomonadales bacterium]|nr:tetratricopeptide repeat protein [Nitrosomonadales bacterium]